MYRSSQPSAARTKRPSPRNARTPPVAAPAALPGSENPLREASKLQALAVFLTTALPIEKLEKSLQINRTEAPRSYGGPALLTPALSPRFWKTPRSGVCAGVTRNLARPPSMRQPPLQFLGYSTLFKPHTQSPGTSDTVLNSQQRIFGIKTLEKANTPRCRGLGAATPPTRPFSQPAAKADVKESRHFFFFLVLFKTTKEKNK